MENVFELMAKYDEQSQQADNLNEGEISAKSDCGDCCVCLGNGCICMSLFADGSCC